MAGASGIADLAVADVAGKCASKSRTSMWTMGLAAKVGRSGRQVGNGTIHVDTIYDVRDKMSTVAFMDGNGVVILAR